jgi:hypothetical protein
VRGFELGLDHRRSDRLAHALDRDVFLAFLGPLGRRDVSKNGFDLRLADDIIAGHLAV